MKHLNYDIRYNVRAGWPEIRESGRWIQLTSQKANYLREHVSHRRLFENGKPARFTQDGFVTGMDYMAGTQSVDPLLKYLDALDKRSMADILKCGNISKDDIVREQPHLWLAKFGAMPPVECSEDRKFEWRSTVPCCRF